MVGRRARNIYVQIDIACPVERVWELTQTPELHERWDLRFTEIQYLPRPDPELPQRFHYATRIGLGLKIRGEGESTGSRDASDGQRNSALQFWSDDSKSLIRSGSGYWKYLPSCDRQSTRFITSYDYNVRFGAAGPWFDRMIFRPLMGWATAWSFDRLRLWIEKEVHPAIAFRQSAMHGIARLALSAVWLYQGVVPKLLVRHPNELAMMHDAGFSESMSRKLLPGVGWFEIGVGVFLIFRWRSRWLLGFIIAAMPVATFVVGIRSPRFAVEPFNPFTLNLSVWALAVVALLAAEDLPSASRCVRRPPQGDR